MTRSLRFNGTSYSANRKPLVFAVNSANKNEGTRFFFSPRADNIFFRPKLAQRKREIKGIVSEQVTVVA